MYLPADVATVVGFYVVSRPFLNLTDPRIASLSQSDRMQVNTLSNGEVIETLQALNSKMWPFVIEKPLLLCNYNM